MAKTYAYANAWLLLLFNATAFADIAENDTSSPKTAIEVSLHSADPAGTPSTGTQQTSEIGYTDYARVAHPRTTTAGWTVTNNVVNPTSGSPITFPAGTGGSGTASHFGVGRDHTGAGLLFYGGTVTPNITCGNGVTPQLSTATSITET